MKYIYSIITAFIICLMTFPSQTQAQCKQFSETEVMPQLGEYIISGRYNTLKLREGEEILIFKTLSKGIDYRILVRCVDSLANHLHFTIKDWEDNTIYDNEKNNYNYKWDYKSEKTQRIKINVFVPKSSEDSPLKEGCVTVITGIKPDM
ncbi:MAG: hypothetical protein J6T96_08230 [Bacteroidales bacterium]|nr:hypothetical protein [Bacteroidales bacterium]MBO7462570.1 hypothetical protein [Bacteroidales bacterium]MBO7567228.1 hypothetical protein [Bacteroidales bacterium]MBP5682023.1 hypothetical protein [Bacteroidales bacterium]